MPANAQISNGMHPLFDSHEERLLRVEDTLHDVNAKVAAIGVTTEYLKESSERSHNAITEKLESFVTELRAHNESVAQKIAQHVDKIEQLDDRLTPVEATSKEEAAKKKESKENWKKILIGAALAAAGVLGTKGAEMLWSKFG